MILTAVIAEYNPFHNGHAHHLQMARTLTHADYLIVIMSGSFVQRGEPALLDKYTRTRMALNHGADLVIELPTPYATGSAEYFAQGALSLLAQLNCIHFLCFGSECADLATLQMIADMLAHESMLFQTVLRQAKQDGLNFPSARTLALQACVSSEWREVVSSIIKEPNNILAIEYLKAIKRQNCPITPVPIPRRQVGYHDTEFQGDFASAHAIRRSIAQNQMDSIAAVTPKLAWDDLKSSLDAKQFLFPNDCSALLNYRRLTVRDYTDFADMTSDLANRLESLRTIPLTWEETCQSLKSKSYTYTHISRALLHLLLDVHAALAAPLCPYARILGFRKSSAPLLRRLKAHSQIPLITKLAAAELNPAAAKLLSCDLQSTHIYNELLFERSHLSPKNEWAHGLELIP